MRIKVGDNVKVLAGDHKGSTGKVVKVFRAKNTALVDGVNLVKKHNKPNANNPKGGITEKEAPINLSNISLVTKDGEVNLITNSTLTKSYLIFTKKNRIQNIR